MTNEAKIREAFEAKFDVLDFTKDKDAWGKDKYQHPYVQCLYEGFAAGMAEAFEAAAKACENGFAQEEWKSMRRCNPRDGKGEGMKLLAMIVGVFAGLGLTALFLMFMGLFIK